MRIQPPVFFTNTPVGSLLQNHSDSCRYNLPMSPAIKAVKRALNRTN